jgi:membrane fusion protein, heavy metal efflux system
VKTMKMMKTKKTKKPKAPHGGTIAAVALAMTATLALAGCGGKKGDAHDHDEPGGHGESSEHGEGQHKEGAKGGEAHQEGVVTLTRAQMTTVKLATAEVTSREVSSEIEATAEIVAPDDGVARVGSKLSGRIMKLPVAVGAQVKAGQLIAVVDSPELGSAKADYLMAVAQARLTRETADREKILFEKKITAERDYRVAEAEATKARAAKEAAEARLHTLGFSDAQLERFSAEQHSSSSIMVTTPIAGIIVERPVALGQVIQPQDTVGVVMDLRTVWMQVDAYERDLAQLAVGQKVNARVPAWPERVFTGELQMIGAVVERRSRTVKVRVVMPNPDGALKPGMFAKVALSGSKGQARQGLFAPSAAVQRDGDKSIVFVPVPAAAGDAATSTEFALREVETGVSADGWVQITRGLAAGEKVVTSGAFQLKSEARRESFGGHEH